MPSFRIRAALAAAPMAALVACGKPAPPPAPPPPRVGYVVVQAQPVALTTELPGRVTAYVTADVRPQVNGIITERLFTEGGDVAKGQALYRIDPKPYQAALDQAKAQLANAQANVVTARLQAQRYADLVKINAISRQDNDNAQAAYGQAAANVQQYRAAVEAAQINLGYTTVRAPVSGRIGRSLVTIGALATSGQTTALATIQALDPIYVDVTQSADELLRLRRQLSQGDATKGATRVSVVLSDGQRYPVEGELRFAEAQVDPTTGSVILRALFPNPGRVLLPGMFVREVLTQAVVRDGVLAPQTAIARDPKGVATAMVVVNGTAQTRPVTLDRAIGSDWLVTSGLKPGDQLITAGASKVQQPGTKVQAVPAAQLGDASSSGAGAKPGGAPGAGGANGTPSSAGRG
jgi:membrane fusion protein, multidrug efflux system